MNKKYTISFFVSIFCLSISLVASINIWNNRSLFFEEYIYNTSNLRSSISNYSSEVRSFLEGDMTEQENLQFTIYNPNTYYYLTLKETGEVFSNLPATLDYETVLSQENMLVYQYIDNKYESKIAEYAIQITGGDIDLSFLDEDVGADENFSGFIFVNKNNLSHGTIESDITYSLSQRYILFVFCAIWGISLVIGTLLFLFIGRKALNINTEWMYKIKMDVHIIGMLMSILLLLFLFCQYTRITRSFGSLTRQIILFFILITLLFGAITFTLTLCVKVIHYRKDKQLLLQNWENRVTKSWPIGLISFILLLCWYSVVVVSLSDRIVSINWIYVVIHIILLIIFGVIIQVVHTLNAQYQKQIIEVAESISKEQIEIEVPVMGNGLTAEIAMAINHIRISYIHSLEERKKSERLKYELVTNISHDLRTPLTLVLNYVELLKREEDNQEKLHYIHQTEKNAEKLHLLINDLFDLSKLESGNVELIREEMDILLLWKQMQNEYRELLKLRNLELIIECKEAKVIHLCDSGRIWRVFDNLLQNAIKYAMEHTRIYVNISEDKEQGRVHIGIRNIAAERIAFEPEELFLRFKRGTEARDTEGSGLGLAIAKSIVLLHDGNIRIETEGDMFKVLIDL